MMLKRLSALLLALLLVTGIGSAFAKGAVVTLPMDEDPMYGIRPEYLIYEEGEKDPVGYEDPSISVRLERGRYLKSDYLAVRVKIANASQIRSTKVGKFGEDVTVVGSVMAKKVKAVFAVNGDFFNTRPSGFVFRQGVMYRKNCKGGHDVLIIDENGDLHVLPKATNEDIDHYTGTMVNAYTFGPCLVLNGEKRTDEDYAYFDVGMYKETQRMAICQTGPLEYLCVTCSGPENAGSTGLTMDQFADLLMTFGDVKIGYNLDGGSSATAIFLNAKGQYAKVNARDSKVRDIKDLIYFASAWDSEAEGFMVVDDEDE